MIHIIPYSLPPCSLTFYFLLQSPFFPVPRSIATISPGRESVRGIMSLQSQSGATGEALAAIVP